MPVITNPLTGRTVRVPYPEAPGDINAQGGVEGDPYGPNPAGEGDGITWGPVPGPMPTTDPPAGYKWAPKQVIRNGIPIGWAWTVDELPKVTPRVGRDPTAIAVDQAQIERMRAQTENDARRAEQQDKEIAIAEGRAEVERLIALEGSWYQKEQAAIARGQLDEARAARIEQNAIARERLGLEREVLALDREYKEGTLRQGNLRANLERNAQAGYVVDAEGTGLAEGTLTADERQRRFQNAQSVQQNVLGALEREQARRLQGLQIEQQGVAAQQGLELQRQGMEQQERLSNVATQTAMASRAKPRIFTPGAVVSRAGVF